jgi:hypothetical protein
MQTILIACRSHATAERAMPVAADLSAACGARLSLALLPEPPRVLTAAAGLDAAGCLSDVLFARDNGRQPIPCFGLREARNWVSSLSERVEDCWEAAAIEGLVARALVLRPDLIVTCEADVARDLALKTPAPVWRVRARQEQSWFLARKVRCAVRGSRAAAWARSFANVLGAQMETMPTRLFIPDNVDLVVVGREERTPLLRARVGPPVVVV